MALFHKVTTPDNNTYGIRAGAIPYGQVDSTSTSKIFTATVDGITEYADGTCALLKNGVVTSASGFTININGLGAKPVYTNLAAATLETTKFNVNYTMLFVYDTTRVSGGAWICYNGYDSNTNTIGYQLRTNSTVMNVSDTARYYKLYFMSADNTMWVPASVNSTNNATAARPVNQRPINPFGRIVYTSANTNYTAGSNLAATTIWEQYAFSLGYSFNRTGEALAMTVEAPVYLKCAPQTDGSAIMDADEPIVQSLPSTKDGKIYIYLGVAYSATNIELVPYHPVYYHDGTGIRLWKGSASTNVSVTQVQTSGTKIATITVDSVGTDLYAPSGGSVDPATATPQMDGTASVGSSTKYAREDHVHPTDTSRQATLVSGTNIKTVNSTSLLGSGDVAVQPTLVSGTNIKTINNNSLLGSGNLTVSGLPTVSATDNGKVLMVVNGAWAVTTLPTYNGGVE